MRYVNLGKTGLKVSQLCLGCMSFGKGKMHVAFAELLDTAQSEEAIERWISS